MLRRHRTGSSGSHAGARRWCPTGILIPFDNGPEGLSFRQSRHGRRSARQPVLFQGRNNPSYRPCNSRRRATNRLIVRAGGAYSSLDSRAPHRSRRSIPDHFRGRTPRTRVAASLGGRITDWRGEDLMLRRLAVVVALSALLFSSGCCCDRCCCRPCWRPFLCRRCCESPCCTPCCTPCAPPVCGPCGP